MHIYKITNLVNNKIYIGLSVSATNDRWKSHVWGANKNSNQAIIKLIASLGAGADVVSVGELERAITAGVEPQKIIFEGIGKTKKDIAFAIEKNIRLINIESSDELERVNKVAFNQNKKINIGIRINPNIDGQTLDKEKWDIDFKEMQKQADEALEHLQKIEDSLM